MDTLKLHGSFEVHPFTLAVKLAREDDKVFINILDRYFHALETDAASHGQAMPSALRHLAESIVDNDNKRLVACLEDLLKTIKEVEAEYEVPKKIKL